MIITHNSKALEVKELSEQNIMESVYMLSDSITPSTEKDFIFVITNDEWDTLQKLWEIPAVKSITERLFLPQIGMIHINYMTTPEDEARIWEERNKRMQEFEKMYPKTSLLD